MLSRTGHKKTIYYWVVVNFFLPSHVRISHNYFYSSVKFFTIDVSLWKFLDVINNLWKGNAATFNCVQLRTLICKFKKSLHKSFISLQLGHLSLWCVLAGFNWMNGCTTKVVVMCKSNFSLSLIYIYFLKPSYAGNSIIVTCAVRSFVVLPNGASILNSNGKMDFMILFQGTLMNDCCTAHFCAPCMLCQLKRDMDYTEATKGMLWFENFLLGPRHFWEIVSSLLIDR